MTPHGQSDGDVEAYLASLDDDQTLSDSRVLITMMQKISGQGPRLWNVGTVGFDSYHYRYDSGREGDSHVIGFYPRKNKLTIYLMDGTSRHSVLLASLGKHTTSRVCIYIRRLSDIDLPTLNRIVGESYDYLKSRDGSVKRVIN